MITARGSSRAAAESATRPVAAARGRLAVRAAAAPQQRERRWQQAASEASSTLAAAGRALSAAALSLALVMAPAAPQALAVADLPAASLAEVVAPRYPLIANDEDGLISRSDLDAFNEDLWLEWVEQGKPLIGNGDPEFALKLFDLNQDGQVTAEEMLRSLALDGAVNVQLDEVDSDIWKVFDTNKNGAVDAGEWMAALGDLGPKGEGAKGYIFYRIDRLSNSDGQLDMEDFSNALSLARDIILGGGSAKGIASGVGGF